MSVNIKYTVALFSALDVSVRRNNMRLARFSLHFARNRMRVSTCIIHVQLAEARPEGQCLVSYK